MNNNPTSSELHSHPPMHWEDNKGNNDVFGSAGAGEDSSPNVSDVYSYPSSSSNYTHSSGYKSSGYSLPSTYSTDLRQRLSIPSAKKNDQQRIQSDPAVSEKKANSSVTDLEVSWQRRKRRMEAMAATLSSWINIERQKQSQDTVGTEANTANLLRDFASRFGFEGSSRARLEAMVFIHQHSVAIAMLVQARTYNLQEKDPQHDPISESKRDKVMTLEEKIANWSPSQGRHSLDEQDPRSSAFYQLVSRSQAFTWLQDRIRKSVCLTRIESAASAIANTVIKQMPRQYGAIGGVFPECCWFEIRVNWNLSTFIREQATVKERGVEEAEAISLERVEHTITITGSAITLKL